MERDNGIMERDNNFVTRRKGLKYVKIIVLQLQNSIKVLEEI